MVVCLLWVSLWLLLIVLFTSYRIHLAFCVCVFGCLFRCLRLIGGWCWFTWFIITLCWIGWFAFVLFCLMVCFVCDCGYLVLIMLVLFGYGSLGLVVCGLSVLGFALVVLC